MGRGAHPFSIWGPAAASLLVNALLIAALLNLGMGRRVPVTQSPALTVMALAVLKGTDEGKEQFRAAAPSQPSPTQAAPPENAPQAPLPPVKPAIAASAPLLPSSFPASPTPVMPMVGGALPTSAPSSSPPAASASTRAAAAQPTLPPRRGVRHGLDVDAPRGTSTSYAAKVRSWLYAHKVYPRRARMRREEGTVQVRFVIDRAGMLIEATVVRGSGHASLDAEADAMMHRAAPYPQAPADVGGDRIEFLAPVAFILPA